MSYSRAGGQSLYRGLSWLLSPVILAHLLWRSLHDGGWLYFQQRLGFAQPLTQAKPLVWLHAASVGEINTALPLLRAMLEAQPGTPFLVTTNTPTGRAALERQGLPNTVCLYLPIDYSHAVKRFYRSHQLQCGIIIETEVWPILYELAEVPLIIVNGRLSHRTLRVTEGWLQGTFKRAANKIHTVLARSEADALGFEKIGVAKQRIKQLGNLKFSSNTAACNTAERATAVAPPISRRFCLLASTHADEELQLSTQWLQQTDSELLVIAPRHPDRAAAIEKQLLSLGADISVRSRQDAVTEVTRIYLADTLGEMPVWYQFASAIFMGGSLVPHGGHNMLEPAQLGKSVITGPHTHNFRHEVELLAEASAIWQVDDAAAAVQALLQWVDTPEECGTMGQRALQVIEQHQHIETSYMEALLPFLRESSSVDK